MTRQTGLILRLLGMLLEVACLIALTNASVMRRLGPSGRNALYGLFFAGLVLVIVGNLLPRLARPGPARKPPRDD